jgi:hypothetical protein
MKLNIPTDWSALSEKQLSDVFNYLVRTNKSLSMVTYYSEQDFKFQSWAATAANLLFKWNKCEVICRYSAKDKEGYLVSCQGKEHRIDKFDIFSAVEKMSWLNEIPSEPIRLSRVDGANAVIADLSEDFSFESWLICENLWQGYQITQNQDLLQQMAAQLYRKADINCTDAQLIGVFYWWASVKGKMKRTFPFFFKDAQTTDAQPSYDDLRQSMDAQLRAITKGDPTKEREVLNLDAWRVLTELNAQAKEYEELNKKYGK